MEFIKIKNLRFTYPGRSVPSLDNISLDIKRGEFVLICGKSGCGKTTLLRHLKPLIAPGGILEGQIMTDGTNILDLSPEKQAKDIGYVFQNPDDSIVCDKVWHELAFGLESLGTPKNEIRTRVAEMASFFGIQNWYHGDVDKLSGGQKQLLNLASVMVLQPSLLILDEPTAQLDPVSAREFLDIVSKINKELGITVILSEHRLEDAMSLCDRVVVMESGRVIANSDAKTVGEILKNEKNDMFLALPAPMRVYYSVNETGISPVTVREGREWLLKQRLTPVEFEKSQAPCGESVIELKDVWFRYEKTLPDILKSASLKVRSGEIYAIVGGNGSGKSTLLSVISGINKPYRGRVKINDGKRVSALSQNPKSLFAHETVLDDLNEMTDDDKFISEIADICGITHFLNSHPYDLSGGEIQRAALAKVLLSKPDILLLDEPTKALDAHFKIRLGELLKSLAENGTGIIMVSHDIDFCAKYGDRAAMFFDGSVLSEDSPRLFFAQKSFYTTAAGRMSRGILNEAVLDDDIIMALGGDKQEFENITAIPFADKPLIKKEKKKHLKKINVLWSVLFAVLFGFIQRCCSFEDYSIQSYSLQILSIVFLGISLLFILPESKSFEVKTYRQKISKITFFSAITVLLLVPLTIYAGIRFFGDRKYYFISLLIITEIMLPFIFGFEKKKPKAKEIVLIAVLCATGVAGRIVFAFLPQFKPLIALVVISGICFGAETGFLVGAITAFASNFYFTHGPWTPWQMFVFGLIGFLSGVLFKYGIIRKNRISITIFGFLSALIIYGGIMNPASVIMWQGSINLSMLWSSIVMGFPVDLIQATATAFFLWFGAEPMIDKLERVKTKYYIKKQ